MFEKMRARRLRRALLKQEYSSCLNMLQACLDERSRVYRTSSREDYLTQLAVIRKQENETHARMQEVTQELAR